MSIKLPPKHIAIIPDGNRRWAKNKGLPTFEGHREAVDKTIPELLEKAAELGVEYITFWALSTENFKKRGEDEIQGIFSLGKLFFKNRMKKFHDNGVCVKFIGDLKNVPTDIQEIIENSTEQTKENTKITFIIAVNYGGRDEIVRAVKKIMQLNNANTIITKDNFGQFLDTKDIPDPDIIIRTGGEKRLSGFMLWQNDYSEIYFSDLFFPDFKKEELEKAVIDFQSRDRRYGK